MSRLLLPLLRAINRELGPGLTFSFSQSCASDGVPSLSEWTRCPQTQCRAWVTITLVRKECLRNSRSAAHPSATPSYTRTELEVRCPTPQLSIRNEMELAVRAPALIISRSGPPLLQRARGSSAQFGSISCRSSRCSSKSRSSRLHALGKEGLAVKLTPSAFFEGNPRALNGALTRTELSMCWCVGVGWGSS